MTAQPRSLGIRRVQGGRSAAGGGLVERFGLLTEHQGRRPAARRLSSRQTKAIGLRRNWLQAFSGSTLFAGREWDAETGLLFYRARYYSADLGRFLARDPLLYKAGDPNLYRYVFNNPVIYTDPAGLKVYWCARDLDKVAVGNHHTIVVVPDNPGDFPNQLIDLYGGEKGFTLAGFKDNDGWLVYEKNQKADVAAVRELNDPKAYAKCPDKYKSGWSMECHEVPAPNGMTDTQFIKKLLEGANNYAENSKSKCFKFNLWGGPNCASWANSLFNYAGISEADRIKLGEFSGVDWGEELLIDDGMWDPPKKK